MSPGQASSTGMSAKEYLDSGPGQRVQSPESFWQPPKHTQQSQSSLRKGSRDDYVPPSDPAFSLTNFPSSTYATVPVVGATLASPPAKPIPIPPPKRHPTTYVQSPPVPESPESQVTDESDSSLVHINPPPREREREREREPEPEPIPPPTVRHSDSLSLTQANLRHHNVLSGSSGILTPLRGDYTASGGLSSTRKRLRAKELSTHGKDTLIQMLVKQESSTDESRKLLRNALDKLEQYKLDMLEANNHCRRLERACQKLTDERMLMHTQLAEAVGKAQQQALAAQQELSICKLRLEHAEQTLATAQVDLREAKLQRDTAKAEAERFRNEAHRVREESNVRMAREQGRKQGYDEGVQHRRGSRVSQSSGTPTPRQITQDGEPATVTTGTNPSTAENSMTAGEGVGGGFIEEANTSGSTTNRGRPSSSRADHNSVSSRDLRLEFEEALEKARKETEGRLQRDLETRLDQERHRLEILNLQQAQAREREFQEEREKLRKGFEESERGREERMRKEVKELEKRMKDEINSDKDKLRKLQQERERERAFREREQREREREREEREKERAAERERLERERERLDMERARDRDLAMQRDRERDRAVAEATRQAAEATANANAAAAAATRPSSESSGGSDHEQPSGVQQQRTFPIPPLPYIPMPRPPMDMPVPTLPTPASMTSAIIPAAMAMPEPTIVSSSTNASRPHSRSTTHPQPALPTTVPVRRGRDRRNSLDSQSSAGGFDSLLTFPPGGRTASGSGGNIRVVPGVPRSTDSTGSNGAGRPLSSTSSAHHRNNTGPYTRPQSGGISGPYTRETVLDGIPEDDSVRASPTPVIPPLPILNMPVTMTMPMPGTTPTLGGPGRTSTSTRREREQQQQPPSWYTSQLEAHGANNGGSDNSAPVIPTIHVDEGGEGPGWRDGEGFQEQQPINPVFLNPRSVGSGLHRSDSANSNRPSIRSTSSYEFNIEPPSNPTSPREIIAEEPPHESQPQNQNHHYLSPLHATVPIPPAQPPLPVRPPGERDRQRTRTGSSSASGTSRRSGRRRDDAETPTEPNSPVIPSLEAQGLPPGFVAHTFTPHANTSSLPDLATPGLPLGFVAQAITDSITGVTTPLTGMSALPNVSGQAVGGGGSTSRQQQSMYGNPNAAADEDSGEPDWGIGGAWGTGGMKPGGSSPYTSSSPLPTGPPVIPRSNYGGDSEDAGGGSGPGSGWPTPSQRARSIYGSGGGGGGGIGTPAAGSTRSLPGGNNGEVYQNPLRQEEEDGDGDGDDLVARNTRINATAPQPQIGKKKKKKGGRS